HLELQLEVAGLAGLAGRGLARRAVGARLEAGVAQTVPAALGDQQALSRLDQVANHLLGVGVDHRGTHRHRQDQILALGAGALAGAALLAVGGDEAAGVAVVDQGVEVVRGFQIDGAAVTAVAAVGAALLDELFAAKTHHAVAAVAGLYRYRYFIDEFHGAPPARGRAV